MAALTLLAIDALANSLLTCVCEAMDRVPTEVPGLMGCPCRRGVVAGTPAADGCDIMCSPLPAGQWPGQLTVNVARLYASSSNEFPREVGASFGGANATVRDNRGCGLPQLTAVELVVTVFRCTPLPTDEGCPPSMAGLSSNAMQVHADMLAVQQGILCCFPGTNTVELRGQRFVMGQTRTIGPQGGCVGFETRLVAALSGCLPCPAPEA